MSHGREENQMRGVLASQLPVGTVTYSQPAQNTAQNYPPCGARQLRHSDTNFHQPQKSIQTYWRKTQDSDATYSSMSENQLCMRRKGRWTHGRGNN